MEVRHLNQRQPADRWSVGDAPLGNWRSDTVAPQYLKIQEWVLYQLSDLEGYEGR